MFICYDNKKQRRTVMADTVNTELNKTTDWQIDFSTLPRWNNRNIVPFVYEKFHHLPKSDTLCCIYSIAEEEWDGIKAFWQY